MAPKYVLRFCKSNYYLAYQIIHNNDAHYVFCALENIRVRNYLKHVPNEELKFYVNELYENVYGKPEKPQY